MSKLDRRKLVSGLGAAALAAGQTETARASDPRGIRVMLFNIEKEINEVRRFQDDFTHRQKVPVVIDPIEYKGMRELIRSPQNHWDVVYVDDVWMLEFANERVIIPLDHWIHREGMDIEGDYSQQILDDMAGPIIGHHRVYYMVPQRADVQVLFYNKRIFQDQAVIRAYHNRTGKSEIKIPNTWDEYNKIAKALHGIRYGDGHVTGTVETLKAPHFAFEFFAPRYWPYGEFFADNDLMPQTPVFAADAGIKALQSLRDSLDYADPRSLDLEHAVKGPNDSIKIFADGGVAMMPQWYSFCSQLSDTLHGIGENLGVALIPGVELNGRIRRCPCLGGGSLAIPARVNRAETAPFAWEFIRYFTSREFSAQAAADRLSTPRTSAYGGLVYGKDDPFQVYRKSLELAHPRPRHMHYNKLEDAIGKRVNEALRSRNPDQWQKLLSAAAKDCDDHLAEDRHTRPRSRSAD